MRTSFISCAASGWYEKAPRSIVSVIAVWAVGSQVLVQVDTTRSDSSSAQEENNDDCVVGPTSVSVRGD